MVQSANAHSPSDSQNINDEGEREGWSEDDMGKENEYEPQVQQKWATMMAHVAFSDRSILHGIDSRGLSRDGAVFCSINSNSEGDIVVDDWGFSAVKVFHASHQRPPNAPKK
jgi:hypothetical protein